MGWYRVFQGLPFDVRIGVVAKRAEMTRAEALALFIALYDCASQASPPGSLSAFDAEEAGVALDIAPKKIEAALEALRDRGFINKENALAEWQKQTLPSTERVRRHRARRRAEGLSKRPRVNPDTPAEAAARRERLQAERGRPTP